MNPIPFIHAGEQEAEPPVNLYVQPAAFNGRPGLVNTPGMVEVLSMGSGEIRGMLATIHGYATYLYVVRRDKVYRIDKNFISTELSGSLNTDSGHVQMVEGGPGKLMITDTKRAYGIDGVTLSTTILPADINRPINAMYMDTYFMLSDAYTGRWYISDNEDPSTFDALDFASAESAPDDIVAIVRTQDDLILMGEATMEIWQNTGELDFPFRKMGGGKVEKGIAARHTAVDMDNSIFWLADDRTVRRLEGYVPVVISTPWLNQIMADMETVSDAFAFRYYDQGNAFYVISFPTDSKTFVYNAATTMWHQWGQYSALSAGFIRHRANCGVKFGNDHLVGDFQNGKIYRLDKDTYTDARTTNRRERIIPRIAASRQRFAVSEIEIELKSGVGLPTGTVNPLLMLQVSKNNGRTWGNEKTGSMGALGQYLTRCRFRRLGSGRDWMFKVAVSDPVEVCLLGAHLRGGPI